MISCVLNAGKARIEIVGSIAGWKESAQAFKKSVQDLIADGITDAHVYINSGGGECFEANEIVNEIKKFSGTITGEGGALVGSAATYIAINCASFAMAENGQFMVHKPSLSSYGSEEDIESALSLLKNMTATYRSAYLAKTTLSAEEFEKNWAGRDWWMTAQQAKDNGFVDSIVGKTKITKATAQMLTACGYSGQLDIDEVIDNKTPKNMDLQLIAMTLSMSAESTADQVTARLKELIAKEKIADTLQAADKARQTKAVSDLLDAAILDKRITADLRDGWKIQLEANFETASKLLNAMKPVVIPSAAPVATDLNGKKYEDLDAKELQNMYENEPEKLTALLEDYKKRNNLQ